MVRSGKAAGYLKQSMPWTYAGGQKGRVHPAFYSEAHKGIAQINNAHKALYQFFETRACAFIAKKINDYAAASRQILVDMLKSPGNRAGLMVRLKSLRADADGLAKQLKCGIALCICPKIK